MADITATPADTIVPSLQKRLKEELGLKTQWRAKEGKFYIFGGLPVTCHLTFKDDYVALHIVQSADHFGRREHQTIHFSAIKGAENIANPIFNPAVVVEKLYEVFRYLKNVPDELKKIYEFDYPAFRAGANKVRLGE